MKNTNGGEQGATTVGHVTDRTDSLAEVLYKPLLEKEIKMTCRVSGQSRSAPAFMKLASRKDLEV